MTHQLAMHALAMHARFPNFFDLFSYSQDGAIVGINVDYTYRTYNYFFSYSHDGAIVGINIDYNTFRVYNCFDTRWYVLELANTSERKNLEKIIDVDEFISAARNAQPYVGLC